MSTVIVINGRPGVGKTTLLKRLSRDLSIGYIAKDDLKELIGDTLHVGSEDVGAFYYGDASASMLYAAIQSFIPSNKVMFVENAFWYDLATPRFSSLTGDTDTKLLQVYVTCDYTEAVRRFEDRRRKGERHPIHPDTVYFDNNSESNQMKYRALDIVGMKTYSVDTTNFDEKAYDRLVTWLKKEIGGK